MTAPDVEPWQFQRVELALGAQPSEPFPTWWDFTSRVKNVILARRGRASEFDTTQPATLTLTLDNSDHALTPGNVTSTYYPNVDVAIQCRVRETVGAKTFAVFRGYLEQPDISDWAECGDQEITLSFVDRLTWLANGRKFISTLAEHILYNGGSNLVAYWPLGDAQGPNAYPWDATTQVPLIQTVAVSADADRVVTPEQIAFAGGDTTPGDDLKSVRFTPRVSTATGAVAATSVHLSGTLNPTITVSSGQTLTVTVWIKPGTLDYAHEPFRLDASGTGGYLYVARNVYSGGNNWILRASSGGGWTASVDGPSTGFTPEGHTGIWQLITAQITLGANPTLWMGTERLTGTTAGSTPGSITFDTARVGYFTGADICHVQVYVGSSAMSYTTHGAQRDMGFLGLNGQLTGARIRTLAGYAGVPSGELLVDDGVSLMRMATLAGKRPLEAMRVAEETEQGVLLADGAGRLVFADRVHRYNL